MQWMCWNRYGDGGEQGPLVWGVQTLRPPKVMVEERLETPTLRGRQLVVIRSVEATYGKDRPSSGEVRGVMENFQEHRKGYETCRGKVFGTWRLRNSCLRLNYPFGARRCHCYRPLRSEGGIQGGRKRGVLGLGERMRRRPPQRGLLGFQVAD